MGPRYSAFVRLLGLALLVLAVSPVTAPFSTFDLIGLLNGSTPSSASLNSKKVADEPASELNGRPTLLASDLKSASVLVFGERVIGSRLLLDIPLRV